MKTPPRTPSATSLPRAPGDEVGSRLVKYSITMGIRMACFVAMVLITPYGWYTWVLAAGAVFLPYVAVVIANVGQDAREAAAESPEYAIEAPAPAAPIADESSAQPGVIRIQESPPRPEDRA